MSDLNTQRNLTDGKGWKAVIKSAHKEVLDKYKTKAKNIVSGVKIAVKKLKGGN